MKVIEVGPSKKFDGCWTCYEEQGVEPAFIDKSSALGYAKARFGGAAGEIRAIRAKLSSRRFLSTAGLIMGRVPPVKK
jgi:hypothetical protein